MDISSVTSGSYNRIVTPTNSGSDRQANEKMQAASEQNRTRQQVESTAQERAQQQRNLEQNRHDIQRRLDGRLYTIGQPGAEVDTRQQEANRANVNRERVKDAYSPAKNELSHAHTARQQERSAQQQSEAIDLVV